MFNVLSELLLWAFIEFTKHQVDVDLIVSCDLTTNCHLDIPYM